MATIEFTAFPRGAEGRGANRRLRRDGKAPGVVYGGPAAPQAIELDHNALYHALRTEAFHSSILSMKLDGSTTKVLLRDVQMHPFRDAILHVDFQRVEENKAIHMKVPLHFINGENSPAVKLSGGIVSHVLTEVDIRCLPKDLPEFIEVDLTGLDVGSPIHVSGLKLPEGVKVVTRGKTDPVVAAGVIPKAHVEVEETVAAEGEAVAPVEGAAPAAEGKAAEGAKPAEGKPAETKGSDKREAGKEEKKK